MSVTATRPCPRPVWAAAKRPNEPGGETVIVSRVINHQGRDIEVRIKRSRRKTLAIHVYPDQPVELRAPLKCAWHDIDRFIASKADWIARSQEHFDREPPPPAPAYVEGEQHPYLGQPCRLVLARGRPRSVWLINDALVVRTSSICPDKVREALDQWYRTRARIVLPDRFEACFADFSKHHPHPTPKLTLRKMRARWGSCASNGEICLNSLLVQKPIPTIDYVITHELCHLEHFAHNKAFYRLMDSMMPDWRERAEELDGFEPRATSNEPRV